MLSYPSATVKDNLTRWRANLKISYSVVVVEGRSPLDLSQNFLLYRKASFLSIYGLIFPPLEKSWDTVAAKRCNGRVAVAFLSMQREAGGFRRLAREAEAISFRVPS